MAADSDTPFGELLREARKARGLSLREISVSTKISITVLQAIECDDIASLPGGIFTRSFVRSYSAAIGLDPAATLQDFLVRFPMEGKNKAVGRSYESSGHHEFQSQQQMARISLGLALISIPIIVFLVYLGMAGNSNGLMEASSSGDTGTVSEIDRFRPARSYTGPPVETLRPPASAPVGEAAALGPLTIDIHPNADCWVSATVDGERRFSRVMRAGEREVLEVTTEVVVNVGNAGAFLFAINQRTGRSLGTSGQVVTARINRGNYRSYVIE